MDLERRHYWRAAVLLWARAPWLGWGSDRFALIHREYVPGPGYDPRARAHSIVLETGVDLGWLGVAALMAWIFGLVAACRLAFRRGWRSDQGAAVAIAAGLCGFAVHSTVDFFLAYTQIALVFWPLAGLLGGLATRAAPDPRAAQEDA
jgi:O-antigen ligase